MPDERTDLLNEGVARGIITAAQRDALRALPGAPAAAEAPAGFTGVNVAYGLGALLVLFASGWFLISQWASLGPWGVLSVAGLYALVLGAGGRALERRGFPRAGQLAITLAIALTPTFTWALLRLAGEWPAGRDDPLWRYGPYIATRFLILGLATLLVALLQWRRRRFPLLSVVLGVALWWIWFQLGQLVGFGREREWYDQWLMLGAGLALLAGADGVERWQRRTDVRAREGDYAGPLWITGVLGFSFAFLVIWLDLDDGKHVILPVAAALIGLSLWTRRRAMLVGGVLGVFGYLTWLASDVFRDGAFFPVALAGIGIAVIFTAVWLQRRFPALATRVGGAEGRTLPWPPALSWLPAVACLALAIGVLARAG